VQQSNVPESDIVTLQFVQQSNVPESDIVILQFVQQCNVPESDIVILQFVQQSNVPESDIVTLQFVQQCNVPESDIVTLQFVQQEDNNGHFSIREYQIEIEFIIDVIRIQNSSLETLTISELYAIIVVYIGYEIDSTAKNTAPAWNLYCGS
jgi:hypothetical protein